MKIVWTITKNYSFKIYIPRKNILLSYPYDQIKVYFNNTRKKLIIFDDLALFGIENLNFYFKQITKGNLNLHYSIQKDIGYLWNQYSFLLTNEQSTQKFVEEDGFWVGGDYLVLQTQTLNTWLYQKDNNIILEITPIYPFFHKDPQPGENYITYEEFMKNYKPLEIIELDKGTIKKWLAQTEELLEIMKSNEEKAEKEYESKQQTK